MVKTNTIDELGILKNVPINSLDLVPMRHMSQKQHETMGSKAAVNQAANDALKMWGANINKAGAHAIDKTGKAINKITGQHVVNTEGTKNTVHKADAAANKATNDWKASHDKAKKEEKMFKNMVTLLILIFNARTVMMMVVYPVNGLGRSKV